LKLSEIKSRIIDAYFTSSGVGVPESTLPQVVSNLCKLINVDPQDVADLVVNDFDDTTTAYRTLSKGDLALGYICDGADMLFVMIRHRKQLACINLTAPSKVERHCTFREVRDAFNEANEMETNVIFKTGFA
jgi:hypothetical protein